jgi:hypothetical protein
MQLDFINVGVMYPSGFVSVRKPLATYPPPFRFLATVYCTTRRHGAEL